MSNWAFQLKILESSIDLVYFCLQFNLILVHLIDESGQLTKQVCLNDGATELHEASDG